MHFYCSYLGVFGEDFGWIRTGPKSADFDPKAWALANCFEDGKGWEWFQTL